LIGKSERREREILSGHQLDMRWSKDFRGYHESLFKNKELIRSFICTQDYYIDEQALEVYYYE
jgi:hypothetical protein